MKRTVQINIGQRLFTIDEDAYNRLSSYLDSLKKYFGNTPEGQEIITDIEDRIADLISDRVRGSQVSVNIDDINAIIKIMGTPQEIDNQEVTLDDQSVPLPTPPAKKLTRIKEGSMIAGVCNGIADYFNIDVSLVRIATVLLTIGGVGFTIPVYLTLWALLPLGDPAPYDAPRKKLYRDPDNKILGGVLSGIAQYFNYKPNNIRLIFGIPFLLILLSMISGPFQFFVTTGMLWSLVGTEILTYVVLWITVPEANSTTARMEMKGEPVNVNTIQSSVHGGTESSENTTTNTTNNSIRRIISILFTMFVVLALLAFIAMMIALVSLMATTGADLDTVKDFVLNKRSDAWGINFVIIMLVLAPICTILYFLLRRTRNTMTTRTFGVLALVAWSVSILGVSGIAANIIADTRTQISKRENFTMQPTTDTLYMAYLNENDYEIDYSMNLRDIFHQKDNKLYIRNLNSLEIDDSPDDLVHLEVKKTSNCSNISECEERIEDMEFATNIVGDTIYVDRFFTINKPQVYRGQRVTVHVALPPNTILIRPESMEEGVSINIENGRVRVESD